MILLRHIWDFELPLMTESGSQQGAWRGEDVTQEEEKKGEAEPPWLACFLGGEPIVAVGSRRGFTRATAEGLPNRIKGKASTPLACLPPSPSLSLLVEKKGRDEKRESRPQRGLKGRDGQTGRETS